MVSWTVYYIAIPELTTLIRRNGKYRVSLVVIALSFNGCATSSWFVYIGWYLKECHCRTRPLLFTSSSSVYFICSFTSSYWSNLYNTYYNLFPMRALFVLAGLFLLVVTATASIPQIEIKASQQSVVLRLGKTNQAILSPGLQVLLFQQRNPIVSLAFPKLSLSGTDQNQLHPRRCLSGYDEC